MYLLAHNNGAIMLLWRRVALGENLFVPPLFYEASPPFSACSFHIALQQGFPDHTQPSPRPLDCSHDMLTLTLQ